MTQRMNDELANLTSKAFNKLKMPQDAAIECVNKWMERVIYCAERMDEEEYGFDFVANLMNFVLGEKSDFRPICDRVICNTQLALCMEYSQMIGSEQNPLSTLIGLQKKETMLPEGVWRQRSNDVKIKENLHSYTIRVHSERSMSKKEIKKRINECVDLIKA